MKIQKDVLVCLIAIFVYVIGMFAIGFGFVMPAKNAEIYQNDVVCKLQTCDIYFNSTIGSSFGTMVYYVPILDVYYTFANSSLLCRECDGSCWADYDDVRCCVSSTDFVFRSMCQRDQNVQNAEATIIGFGVVGGLFLCLTPLVYILFEHFICKNKE